MREELEVTADIMRRVLETTILENDDDVIQEGVRQVDKVSQQMGITADELLLEIVKKAVLAGHYTDINMYVKDGKLYMHN